MDMGLSSIIRKYLTMSTLSFTYQIAPLVPGSAGYLIPDRLITRTTNSQKISSPKILSLEDIFSLLLGT